MTYFPVIHWAHLDDILEREISNRNTSILRLGAMATSPPKIPFCYATCSIDTDPPSPLPAKLSAISAAGFQAIELSFPDLLSFAQQHLDRPKSDDSLATDYDALCEAGKEVRKLCENEKLKILVLQPFANFEGWEKGSAESEDAWSRARGWVRIMEAVGTDMLQVGFLP